MKDRFVGRMSVERHHGAGSAGRSRDLGAPAVPIDRRYFDAVLAAIDRFVEALYVHGKAAF
jgi:hypothetical protein